MRENILFRAKTFFGKYKINASVEIDSIDDYELTIKNDNLYLANNKNQFSLVPINEGATEILNLFDTDPFENSSLYEMECNGDVLEVTFHRFSRPVLKMTSPNSGHLYFYFESGLVATEEENGKTEYDLIRQIKNDCIRNNSIFISVGKDMDNKFTILGDDYGYYAKNERGGVFRIDDIKPVPRNVPEDRIIQIYKGFDFITWKDSLGISSQNITQIVPTNIPKMISAWDNYIHFLSNEIKEKQERLGSVHFNFTDIEGNYLFVYFDETIDLENNELFNGENELEAVDEDTTGTGLRIKVKPWFLGEPSLIDSEGHRVGFIIYDYTTTKRYMNDFTDGYLRLSSRSIEIETSRREEAYELLTNQSNSTSLRLRRMMDPTITDTSLPTTERPVTNKVLQTMFGKEKAETMVLSETYRSAMDIALNTPDIAIIQGPPGCGKTTLINGVMARINEIDPNAKILLTTEQHDALENAVKGVNGSVPPLVISKRFNSTEQEEAERLERTIKQFRNQLVNRCNELVDTTDEKYSHQRTEKLVYSIQKIKRSDYDKTTIQSELQNIKNILIEEGILSEVSNDIAVISSFASNQKVANVFESPLLKLINSQRTTEKSWNDDGLAKLEMLNEALDIEGYGNYTIDEDLINSLKNNPSNEVFERYQETIDSIRRNLFPHVGETEEEKLRQLKTAISNIEEAIKLSIKGKNYTIDDIIYEFSEKIKNMDNILQVVRNYASIVASTCAQAKKMASYSTIASEKAKYVVIDEAARINPLDLINTILMGTKIILVGDQNQLPQYLESQAVKRFRNSGETLAKANSEYLKDSLFGSLYENLEKAYKEGRIKTKRTIRLDEQYRMNPIIGNFISNEFYDGELKSAEETKKQINTYGVFDGKSVVFVDIPMTKENHEEKAQTEISREVEVTKIVSILSSIFANNPNKELDIGVLSFYKAQINKIEEAVKTRLSTQISEITNNVEFGTIDSFQGKQFDIVIISCVRSNACDDARSAVGFLFDAPNRINVSLSRAKKLLVLVGDSSTLSASEPLAHFIQYAKENGHYERSK